MITTAPRLEIAGVRSRPRDRHDRRHPSPYRKERGEAVAIRRQAQPPRRRSSQAGLPPGRVADGAGRTSPSRGPGAAHRALRARSHRVRRANPVTGIAAMSTSGPPIMRTTAIVCMNCAGPRFRPQSRLFVSHGGLLCSQRRSPQVLTRRAQRGSVRLAGDPAKVRIRASNTTRTVRGLRAARARSHVLYATGFFGGFGFLGFGGLFGVLSPTWHLLHASIEADRVAAGMDGLRL